MCSCKIISEPDVELVLPHKDLTQYIDIKLQLLENTEDQVEINHQTLSLKVKVSDQISRLVEYANKDAKYGVNDYILGSDGKRIEDIEQTFAALNVKECQLFSLIYYRSKKTGPKMWRRFKSYVKNDYQCLYRDRDAMIFVPKRNIIFYGFGMFANY